ncbi:sialate O-acetylesterase isoform X2 [Hydra vulgaris]|uniref:Sialate O-acetylesterase isoform X2 n=1 Tax=Hydra vulgaris TaxID=6087 RepID=A0ABM4BG30_HYDVU
MITQIFNLILLSTQVLCYQSSIAQKNRGSQIIPKHYESPVFRFANHYAHHMVLQKSPYRSIIWGFGQENSDVIIEVKEKRYQTVVQKNAYGENVWNVTLDPQDSEQPFLIQGFSTVKNNLVTIDLKDVLFGNVWICGGQSNMQFSTNQAFTSTEELNISSKYTSIRLFTAGRYYTNVATREISTSNILQQWTLPSRDSVATFSAVCWMYGRRLYDIYKVPIGLISSNQGGSCIESWSSPQTLKVCNATSKYPITFNNDNVLWNAMISPFLKTTIYGVIWYQGEQNAINPEGYNCTFPAMVNGWRKEWSDGTGGQTNMKFPFGFVQLASFNDNTIPGFPTLRWLQTAGYGYVPNKQQENTFMAVTMDLADNNSPYGSIHPRDKADVAERLVLAVRAVVFKENVHWTGPIFSKAAICLPFGMKSTTIKNIVVYYKVESVEAQGIMIASLDGFEVLQSNGNWIQAQVSYSINNKVLLTTNVTDVHALRYAWKPNPCAFKSCAIYSATNLPSPPFITYGPFQYIAPAIVKSHPTKYVKMKLNHKDAKICQFQ